MAYDIAQLDSADFAELANTLGDTPERVVVTRIWKQCSQRELWRALLMRVNWCP